MPSTIYGYWRCVNDQKDQEKQIKLLEDAGCEIIVGDFISGVSDSGERKELSNLLEKIKKEDQLILGRLNQISEGKASMLFEMNKLLKKGVKIKTLDGRLDTRNMNVEIIKLKLISYLAKMDKKLILYSIAKSLYASIRQRKPSIFLGTFQVNVIDRIKTIKYPFEKNFNEGLKLRKYKNYEEYLKHQKSKFKNMESRLEISFDRRSSDFYNGFKSLKIKKRSSILCLGSRDGAEVKALRDLGHLAIGIDLKFPQNNKFTHYGDFQNIPFPNEVFNLAYTNCFDHIQSPTQFLKEVGRILDDEGIFIADLTLGYDVIESFAIENFKIGIDLIQANGFNFDENLSGFNYLQAIKIDESQVGVKPRFIFKKAKI